MRRGIIILFTLLLSTVSLLAEEGQAAVVKKDKGEKEIPKVNTVETVKTVKAAPEKDQKKVYRLKELKEQGRELAAFKKAFEIYQSQSYDYSEEILNKVIQEYKHKVAFIDKRYRQKINNLEDGESVKRANTIAMMERFIRKYPRDQKFTPDVLFRLADLHFEKAELDYDLAQQEHERNLALFDAKKLKKEPKEPQKDYSKTLYYFKRIINDFPEYNQIDGAYYLTGYIYLQQKKDTEDEKLKVQYAEEAKKYFEQLVNNYPESPYKARSYLRIAEYFYGKRPDPNKPATYHKYNALEYYQKALDVKGSDVYDYAMYKMAWSHYTIADEAHLEDYDKSIKIFSTLVEKYDSDKDDEIKLYREEAIEFIAISFVEGYERNMQKIREYVTTSGKPDYAREVLVKVAQAYFDGQIWRESINVNNMVLEYYPLHYENPILYDYIITAYLKLGDEGGSIQARERFLKDYSEGSAWHQANINNEKAMVILTQLNAKHLYDAAIFHNQQAQLFQEKDEKDKALAAYGMASQLYNKFLLNYPLSEDYYDVQYYYGITLYQLKNYDEAAKMFKKVRDNNEKYTHAEDASYRLILAYQEALKQLVLDKKTPEIKMPSEDELEKLETIESIEMNDYYKELIATRRKFITMFPKHKDTPVFLFYNAQDYYKHLMFDEARKDLFELLDRYPETITAQYALEDIYKSYIAQRKYDDAEKFYTGIQKNPKFSSLIKKKEDLGKIKKLQTASVYKKALRLNKQKKYQEAAGEYMRLYNSYPNSEFSLDALRSASTAYKDAKIPLKRIDILKKIITFIDKDKKNVKDKTLQDEVAASILEIADISERFFDFQVTITYFEKYLNRFPKGGDVKYVYGKLPELYYNNQRYQKAAELYKSYGTRLDEKNQIAYIFYSINAYKKGEKWRQVIRGYLDFIRRFGNKAKYKEQVIVLYFYIYETYLKMNEKKMADKFLKKTYVNFKKLKSSDKPEYKSARYYAARANFLRVERQLPAYEQMPLGGRNPAKSIQNKIKSAKYLFNLYNSVATTYKEPEWAIAAFFRKGYLNKQFAEALFAVKPPSSFNEDEKEVYTEELEEFAEPFLDQALKMYEDAYTYAKKVKIDNEWTTKLLIELNKMDKEQYKLPPRLIDEERSALQINPQPDLYTIEEPVLEEKTSDKDDEEDEK